MMKKTAFSPPPRRLLPSGIPAQGPAALLPAVLVLVCLLASSLAGIWAQTAQAAPALCLSGEVTLLLPQPEDSQTDSLYFALEDAWTRHTGTHLDFSHRPGRGGGYALRDALDAPPDGCTLAAVQLPSLYLQAEAAESVFTPEDIVPAGVFAALPLALWVAEDSPFQDTDDLVRHMRAAVAPGENVAAVAGTGKYTDQHLAFLRFERAAGAKGRYIPALGSADSAKEVLEGRAVACIAYALQRESMPGMRPLAVASAKRSRALPDTPTLYEREIAMESVTVFGLALSASIPEDARAQYREALAGLARDASLAGALAALGAEPVVVPSSGLTGAFASWAEEARAALDEYSLIPRNRRR